MATKTQSVMDNLNYFTGYKESNPSGFCDAYSQALKDIIGIFGNQVAHGLCTEEQLEFFKRQIPATSEIFNQAKMHPDLSFMPGYFDALVSVNQATITQKQAVR